MEESLKFEIRKGKVRNSVKKRNTITDTKDFLVFYIEMPLHVRNILINNPSTVELLWFSAFQLVITNKSYK